MMTKKEWTAFAVLFSVAAGLSVSSCINPDYDLEKLNTEVTVGGKDLIIPVGETEKITMEDLMSEVDQDVLQTLENGAYALQQGDHFDLTDRIPDLSEKLKISDLDVRQDFSYTIEDFGDTQMEFQGESYREELSFDDADLLKKLELPELAEKRSQASGIWNYSDEIKNMQIGIGPLEYKTKRTIRFSDYMASAAAVRSLEVPLPFNRPVVFPEKLMNVDVEAQLPEGVTSVDQVTFDEQSRVKVTLKVQSSFITRGTIVPSAVLDLSSLLTFHNQSSVIELGNDFVLNKENGYQASVFYKPDQVLVTELDWKNGKLVWNKKAKLSGSLNFSDLYTTMDHFTKLEGDLDILLKVEFIDLKIKSAEAVLAGKTLEKETYVPVEIADMELMEGVKCVKNLQFDENSIFSLDAYAAHLQQIPGLVLNLDELTISAPADMHIEGFQNGQVSYTDESLENGLHKQFRLLSMDLKDRADGRLSYSDQFKVKARFTVSGKVKTDDLPTTEAQDLQFSYEVKSKLKVADGLVICDQVRKEIPVQSKTMRFDLPSGLEQFETLTLYPDTRVDPVMVFNIHIPENQLALRADHIVVRLPEFIKFKNVDPAYNYNEQDNALFINGALPERILLPVDRLVIHPQKEAATGNLYVEDQLEITGAVALDGNYLFIRDLNDLVSEVSYLSLDVPALKVDRAQVGELKFDFDQEEEVTLLLAKDMPEEVVSIQEVQLQDVQAAFDLNFKNLPDFGPGIRPEVDLYLTVPSEIQLADDPRISGQQVHLTGSIVNGQLAVEPVAIQGLDLSNFQFKAGKDLTARFQVKGQVLVHEPSVKLEEVSGRTIEAAVRFLVKDIRFDRIEAVVDYETEEFKESILLDDFPDFFRNKNTVLDLADPSIRLKAETNIGIPMTGSLVMVPYFDGQADPSEAIRLDDVAFPWSTQSSENAVREYYIGNNSSSCPEGHVFLKADLSRIIRRVPDKLEISFTARTDKETEVVVEPESKYLLNLDYQVVVPLAFGKDLKMEMTDTISNLPEIMGDILEKNSVGIRGEITNSLPLQLNMNMKVLDFHGNVIPLAEEINQVIDGCKADGTVAVTPLEVNLKLAPGADASQLTSILLTFTVTSSEGAGLPVTQESFVQARLKACIPEGISLDLKDLQSQTN